MFSPLLKVNAQFFIIFNSMCFLLPLLLGAEGSLNVGSSVGHEFEGKLKLPSSYVPTS